MLFRSNLSLIKTFEYFNYVLNIWLDDNKRFELEIDHVLKYINGQFYFIDRYSENNPICPCKLLVIWPNGNITWCQDLYSTNCVIANIYSDSPEQIYSAYLPYKQKTIFEMKKYLNDCGTCGFIHFCGTGCRANAILEENGYFGKDEEICSLYTSGLYKKIASTLISNKDNIL